MRRLTWFVTTIALAAASCSSSDVSRELGARCTVSADCDDRCLAPGTDYPGGLCTQTCDRDDDCPDNGRCITDQGGVCLYPCDGDPACTFLGSGWTCQLDSDQTGGQVQVCKGS